MNKIKGIAFLVVLIFIFGCTPQPTPVTQPVEQPTQEVIVIEEPPPIPEPPEIQPVPTPEPQSAVKEFTMTATKWDFTPSTITVNEGDTVKITITSTDVAHGFQLRDFNINERLDPNQPVTIEFVADKAGTFSFKCNVPCGSGHSTMDGTLIVE